MKRGKRLGLILTSLVISLYMMCGISMDASAVGTKEYLDSLSVGVSNAISTNDDDLDVTAKEGTSDKEAAKETSVNEPEEESDLVMADVKAALNVRAEPSEDSEKVGLLYKDCGGHILERKNGWTKLESGDLVGWAKDEYLLFGADAEALASEVGNMIVTIETDGLRVRREPDEDAEILGWLAQDDALEVIEVINDEWINVYFENDKAYVSAKYVDMDFHIDAGETMASIKKREEEAAAAKKKAIADANQAVIADADDLRLMAALIQCEAGAEPYEGKLAVASVVMNRVRSGAYPNTISGVIYASGQFTPAMSGKVAKTYNNGKILDSCYQAAQEAMSGVSNVGDATHFRVAGNHDGLIIGHQVFW
ncbi:MAG: cell wall hydrolase [Clostridiales bacterium]|nr:cell wall hydrolase [Clostridiales bacterium]